MDATTAQIFLAESRGNALQALANMAAGIDKYAAKPDANAQWVDERRTALAHVAAYVRQLEATVTMLEDDASARYQEGYRAGRRRTEQPGPADWERHPTPLGIVLSRWLNDIKQRRQETAVAE